MDINCSTDFDCTPEQLWPWIAELDRLPRWMKGLESATPTKPGPLRAGSTYTMHIKEGPRVAEYSAEIKTWEPPRKLALEIRGGSFGDRPALAEYRLEPTSNGTRLDHNAHFETGGVLRFLAPLFMWFARMQLRSFMKKLQQLVEAEHAAAS